MPLIANPLPREQTFKALDKGKEAGPDNFHQTIMLTVQRPIPIPVIGRPGCWNALTSTGDGARQPATGSSLATPLLASVKR